MLRLKQCLDDCNIKQQALADATGWSKTAISITLNSGKLPANSVKFKLDVLTFATRNQQLYSWMNERDVSFDQLFENVIFDDPDLIANEHGETPFIRPEWSCSMYGEIGHDRRDCRDCARRYEGRTAMLRGRAAVFGGAV